jgi:hypothetical protein
VGPFDNVTRPFTVNGSNTLAFGNINGLLGFEMRELRPAKALSTGVASIADQKFADVVGVP